MRVCAKCGDEKPDSEYCKSSGSRGGRRPQCKSCEKARATELREQRRERGEDAYPAVYRAVCSPQGKRFALAIRHAVKMAKLGNKKEIKWLKGYNDYSSEETFGHCLYYLAEFEGMSLPNKERIREFVSAL